jgi:flagellar assembly protein FliH
MGYIVKAAQVADSAVAVESSAERSNAVAAQLTETLMAARAAADAAWAAARDAAPILARKMAEKIIGHAVDLDPSVMADIAEQALRACRGPVPSVVIRVHADDLAALERAKPGWLERKQAPTAIRFVADPTVGRYGCVLETPGGRVNARLDSQLEVLERVLAGDRRGG